MIIKLRSETGCYDKDFKSLKGLKSYLIKNDIYKRDLFMLGELWISETDNLSYLDRNHFFKDEVVKPINYYKESIWNL